MGVNSRHHHCDIEWSWSTMPLTAMLDARRTPKMAITQWFMERNRPPSYQLLVHTLPSSGSHSGRRNSNTNIKQEPISSNSNNVEDEYKVSVSDDIEWLVFRPHVYNKHTTSFDYLLGVPGSRLTIGLGTTIIAMNGW
jgi:hypothetical protein